MTTVHRIQCKDCKEWFTYSEETAQQDRLLGGAPPERCTSCRPKHRKEYQSLGISHYPVLQLRTGGSGGLAFYRRERAEPEIKATQRLDIKPFPIETIIGEAGKEGTLLHGLLRDPRRIHLVVGPTGSGKSTWLPFRLLTCAELVARGPILVTQPRIPATVGPANFVSKMYYGSREKDPDTGEEQFWIGPGLAIGYRYREIGASMTDSANRMVFMTDGTLLNWIQTGEVRRYSVVMIDEAHERSLNIDKILALLRFKLSRFPQLQVLIASATVDAETFLNYFGGRDQVAVYASAGFTYPILEVFADETVAYCPNLWEDSGVREMLWDLVTPEDRTAKLLGPEPCWNCRSLEPYRLRYYPLFESLVFQGIVTDVEQGILLRACDDAPWQTAVQELALRSARTRRIGKDSIPITESIRKNDKKAEMGKPVRVDKACKDRLIEATVEAVIDLIERDQAEAPRRLARWQRKELFGWPKLQRPLPVGHLLAFLPSSSDINTCAEKIQEELEQRGWHTGNVVLRFYREAPQDEKKAAVAELDREDPESLVRKIVIGSNLAETSLTLDGLTYVVDSGLICEEYFDPAKGKELPTVLHSQAGCRQRAGRVGRKEPGEAYRLYTRKELSRQAPYTTPQIARCNAESVILDLVRSGLPPDQVERALMNPPAHNEFERAFRELTRFEAIDADGDITHTGEELAAIQGDSMLAKKLLCEADRFGVLWEMAVFLSMMALHDSNAPRFKSPDKGQKLPRRWLGVWDPTHQILYDDADEPETDEASPESTDAAEAQVPAMQTALPTSQKMERSIWDNPYLLGDTLLKRAALLEGCLDDLELYLRLWQGWFPWPDDDTRLSWAQAHGVNHEALKKVEATLRGDEQKAGLLGGFWALDQKGEMGRDVDVNRLDMVRFLYAAGFPDRLYQRNDFNPEEFTQVHGPLKKRPAFLHPETVWYQAPIPYLRHDAEVRRTCCVATARKAWDKENAPSFLRHVVWLAPEWIEEGFSLTESPISLARRLAPLADRARSLAGEVPFLTGSRKAGFRWPMPAIPTPDLLQIGQWRVQFQTAIAQARLFQAQVTHVVDDSRLCAVRLVFVQIPGGPLVPLKAEADQTAGLHAEQELAVKLVFKEGLIQAVLEKTADAQVEANLPRDKMEFSQTPQPATVASPQVLEEKVVPLRRPVTPGAPARPAESVGRDIPRNAVVEAEVKEILTGEFVARVATAPYQGMEKRIECSERMLHQEVSVGRRLRFRMEGDHRGRFVGWTDRTRPVDFPERWPVGTLIEVEVVEPHPDRPYLVKVRVQGGFKYPWFANTGQARAREARPGRRMQVEVKKWLTERRDPWPHLQFRQWLD